MRAAHRRNIFFQARLFATEQMNGNERNNRLLGAFPICCLSHDCIVHSTNQDSFQGQQVKCEWSEWTKKYKKYPPTDCFTTIVSNRKQVCIHESQIERWRCRISRQAQGAGQGSWVLAVVDYQFHQVSEFRLNLSSLDLYMSIYSAAYQEVSDRLVASQSCIEELEIVCYKQFAVRIEPECAFTHAIR